MSAAAADLRMRAPLKAHEPRQVTLLELVYALSEVTEDDREVVATALDMLRSGRVRLRGTFRNTPIEDLG